jgi:hypothetical protein
VARQLAPYLGFPGAECNPANARRRRSAANCWRPRHPLL